MATATKEDIERIVREVVAQWRAGPSTAVATAPPAPADAPPEVSPAARDGEVFVDCRVVTLQQVAGRLAGAKHLVVPKGALVTPSVRDELRRKGVALVRQTSPGNGQTGKTRVLLVAGPSGHDPAAAVQALSEEGFDVRMESSSCLVAATDKLAAAVASGQTIGLLWTRHAAVGLCLANRHAAVRAVLATGVAATATAVSAVGANVLVIDPAIGTAYENKQILREFCVGGIRQCPEALRERLGRQTGN